VLASKKTTGCGRAINGLLQTGKAAQNLLDPASPLIACCGSRIPTNQFFRAADRIRINHLVERTMIALPIEASYYQSLSSPPGLEFGKRSKTRMDGDVKQKAVPL